MSAISHSDKYCPLAGERKLINSTTYCINVASVRIADSDWIKLMPGMVAMPFISWMYQEKKKKKK